MKKSNLKKCKKHSVVHKNECISPSPEHPCLCDCHIKEPTECLDCKCGRHMCARCSNSAQPTGEGEKCECNIDHFWKRCCAATGTCICRLCHPEDQIGSKTTENELKEENQITIHPSGRIDYCVECDAEHGYDCPKDNPQPSKGGWEEEFGSIIIDLVSKRSKIGSVSELNGLVLDIIHSPEIRTLVSSLLTSEITRLVGEIEGMKIEIPSKYFRENVKDAHNGVLDEVIKLIKK